MIPLIDIFQLMIPFKILIFLLPLIIPSYSQFAEIAGIVGSVLPTVLGPAASGAASGAASAASLAGAGATGALANIGSRKVFIFICLFNFG